MKDEELRNYYLAKAKEAAEMAALAAGGDLRDRWVAMSEGYKVLAQSKYSRREK